MTGQIEHKAGDPSISQKIETPPPLPVIDGAVEVVDKAKSLLLQLDKAGQNNTERYRKLHSLLVFQTHALPLTWRQDIYSSQELVSDLIEASKPIEYTPEVNLATKDRGDIELISEPITDKEASKKFFQEERDKIASELREARKVLREKMKDTTTLIESSPDDAKKYLNIQDSVSNEANTIANDINSPADYTMQDGIEVKQSIDTHIENSSKLKSLFRRLKDSLIPFNKGEAATKSSGMQVEGQLDTTIGQTDANIKEEPSHDLDLKLAKEKLRQLYEQSELKAKENYDTISRSVEQTILRNKAFFVHTFILSGPSRHNANSNITQHATLEDDIDLLLSLEPSISTSSVLPGSKHLLWGNDGIGVIIGGGNIGEFGKQDIGTTATRGIKGRGSNKKESLDELDKLVSDKSPRAKNELVVNNPEVFGLFLEVKIDENGEFYSEKLIEKFKEKIDIATKKGLLPLVMTPDRRVFEFKSIDENGKITVVREIKPEEVAKGKAGLTTEKRKEIGQGIVFEKLLKNISDIEEAKGIISQLSGEEVKDLTREEYVKYLKYNPEKFSQLPKELLADRQFILSLLDSSIINPMAAYEDADESLQTDMDFIKKLISYPQEEWGNNNVYYELPIELKRNRDILIWALDNPTFRAGAIDYSFIEDKDIIERLTNKAVDLIQLDDVSDNPKGKWDHSFRPYLFDYRGTHYIENKMFDEHDFLGKIQKKYPQYSFEVEKLEDGRANLHYKQKDSNVSDPS